MAETTQKILPSDTVNTIGSAQEPFDTIHVNNVDSNSVAKANHTHDSRYYTEDEIDAKLDGKANSSHTHSQYLTGITKDSVVTALGYTPPTTNTTYDAATQSAAGLMTAADKKKLDGIAAEANAYSLPGTVSFTNLTVTGALNIPGGQIWIE